MADAVKPANKTRVTTHTTESHRSQHTQRRVLRFDFEAARNHRVLTCKPGHFGFPARLESQNERLKTLELPYYFTRLFGALFGGEVEKPALWTPTELGQNGGEMFGQRQQQPQGSDAIFVARVAGEVSKAG